MAAEELLRQAEAKYEAALRIKPDDHEALNNWGNALAARARRASDASAAEELLRQAEAKYEAGAEDEAGLPPLTAFQISIEAFPRHYVKIITFKSSTKGFIATTC